MTDTSREAVERLARAEAAEARIEALTAERDALKAGQIDAIRAALDAAISVAADWYHNIDKGTPQDEIRALDPAAIAAKLKGDGNDR